MTKKKPKRSPAAATSFDQARDELFSHILRCGVIEALPEHQKEWFDDTMQYLADRYEDLGDETLRELRTLGERYCQPVQRRAEAAHQVNAGSVAV
jgi:hypothetical protein